MKELESIKNDSNCLIIEGILIRERADVTSDLLHSLH